MRTTVNIDDHLLEEAKVLAARQHRSLSAVVDDALRITLCRQSASDAVESLSLPVWGGRGAATLVDLDDKEALAEAMGDNEWPRADS